MPIPAGYVRKHFGLRPDWDEALKLLASRKVEKRGMPVTQTTLIIEALLSLDGFEEALTDVQHKRQQEQQ